MIGKNKQTNAMSKNQCNQSQRIINITVSLLEINTVRLKLVLRFV